MVNYYLGFDIRDTQSSLAYVIRNAIINLCEEKGLSYTFNIEDDFQEAVLPSGISYFSHYAYLKKKGVKVSVLAGQDSNDFSFRIIKGKKVLSLSLDAINYYRKADRLYVILPSLIPFIRQFKIDTKIQLWPIISSQKEREILPSEKDAFLHYYQILPDQEVIVSYGLLTSKKTMMDLLGIARNSPEKEFLFFGKVTPEASKLTTFESIGVPENLRFYPDLPEELYPSFLLHCSRLLLVGDYLCYPQVMIDCIEKKIPIITYKLSGYEEILNPEDVSITNTYSALYDVINKPSDPKKAELAYQTLLKLKNR